MLVWVRAATLPTVMVSTETTIRSCGQSMVPTRSHSPVAPEEEAGHHREAGGLGGHRQEGRDRRGRALVHVGAPEVEGHAGRLEAEAGQDEERDHVHAVAVALAQPGGEELAYAGQAGGAG